MMSRPNSYDIKISICINRYKSVYSYAMITFYMRCKMLYIAYLFLYIQTLLLYKKWLYHKSLCAIVSSRFAMNNSLYERCDKFMLYKDELIVNCCSIFTWCSALFMCSSKISLCSETYWPMTDHDRFYYRFESISCCFYIDNMGISDIL